MKKISLFFLILISISVLSVIPINALPKIDTILVANEPLIQKSDNFIVTWMLIKEQPYLIDISIQNLKDTKQDVNITSLFSNLNTDGLEVMGFYEWKNITNEYEQPIYNITDTHISPNGIITETREITGYETITMSSLQWKPSRTRLFTKSKNEYKESYETINIPKLHSKAKDATVNGTKRFRIEFKTPMISLSGAWGSKGTIALNLNGDIFDPEWLTDWDYRKSHIITNATGAGVNYQINVTVHYSSGTDGTDNVYLNTKSQTDFDDIRWCDNDGETLLDCWIQEKTDSDNARFWFEVQDDLSTENVTVYIYYGNDAVSTTSNGDNTFPFFDTFDGDSLDTDKWTSDGVDSVSGGELTLSNVEPAGLQGITGKVNFGNKYAVMTRSKITVGDYGWLSSFSNYPTTSNWILWFTASPTHTLHSQTKKVGGSEDDATHGNLPLNVYYIFEIKRISNSLIRFYQDDTFIRDVIDSNDIPTGDYPIRMLVYRSTLMSEWVLIRKCVNPEPKNNGWGEEETSDLYATFYNQTNSVFMVNGTRQLNSTQTQYKMNDILELQGIINISTQFIRFDWNDSYTEINPYNYTITTNVTIWLMTSTVLDGNGFIATEINALPMNLLFYASITTIGLIFMFKTEYVGKITGCALFAFLAIWISNDVLFDVTTWYIQSYNITSGVYQYVNTVTHIDTPLLSVFMWLNLGLSLICGIDLFSTYRISKRRKG